MATARGGNAVFIGLAKRDCPPRPGPPPDPAPLRNRRNFLPRAAAASTATITSPLASRAATDPPPRPAGGGPGAAREYYGFRAYRLASGADRARLEHYLGSTLIPAANALGVRAVGVFPEPGAKDGDVVRVRLPYASPELAARIAALPADPAFARMGADYLAAPKEHPALVRVDSWLLPAFAGQPRREIPAGAATRAPWVFELRTDESFSEERALKKIAMCNTGEIQRMHELGLAPVFYGQALVGRDRPHLTDMRSAPDLATHRARWKEFGQHPAWLKMKADPEYADTVARITSRFLEPLPCSQI